MSTCAEIQEARPQFLVRTSQILKKVSNLRNRRKSENRPSGDMPPYQRSTQSMDLGSKALTKLELRVGHSSDHSSGDDAPCHVSLRSPPYPHHAASTVLTSSFHPNQSAQTTSPPLTSSPRRVDGLPLAIDDALHLSVHDGAPMFMHSRAQTLPPSRFPSSEVVTSNSSQSVILRRRAIPPRLATLPPPLMAQYTAGGSARLTPSIVSRQPPMPILNLPTLPPPTPSQPTRPVHPTAPLRSLPALPMQGPSDADPEGDQENASLEDEDEEDVDDGAEGAAQGDGSDESDDGEDASSPPHTASYAGPSRLPHVDTSGFSVSFQDAGLHSATPQTQSQAGSSVDYFSSKSPEPHFSPMRTPRASDVRQNAKTRPLDRAPQPRMVPMPATPDSPRPGLYHHASKSMIDITSVRKDKDQIVSPKLGRTVPRQLEAFAGAGQPRIAEPQILEGAESADDVITAPMIRRRRSLPVYEPSSDPPPYPDPLFRRKGPAYHPPQPREDEGRESLPSYTNSIYLSGPMPRKMEFSQPGVQAKDRKWRRVWCVLEGTAFRVYKCPPAAAGVSAIEQWWEKRVGVGDTTSVNVTAITASGMRVSAIRERQKEPENGRIPKIAEESSQELSPRPSQEPPRSREPSPPLPSSKSVLGLTSRFLRRQRSKSVNRVRPDSISSTSRLSVDSRQETVRNPAGTASRHSMDTLSSSRPSNVSSSASQITQSTALTAPSPTPTSSRSFSDSSSSRFSRTRIRQHSTGLPEQKYAEDKEKNSTYTPDPKDFIQQYTLQNAESGLASDYQKRKNVIRVRMEGEQFLLQAKDVAAVIDWIEGIQMGTNVALDLDERPMPRGPIFPRRRRRRPRRSDAAAGTAAASTSNASSTAAPHAS